GKLAGGPGFPIEAPRRHMRLEGGLEGRDQLLKLVEGQTGEIQELQRAGLYIGKPDTGHLWYLLSREAQYIINRDNLNCTPRLLPAHAPSLSPPRPGHPRPSPQGIGTGGPQCGPPGGGAVRCSSCRTRCSSTSRWRWRSSSSLSSRWRSSSRARCSRSGTQGRSARQEHQAPPSAKPPSRAASSPSTGHTRVDQNRRAMAVPPCGTQHTPACPPSPPLPRPGQPRPSPGSIGTGYVPYGTDRIWGTISCLWPSPFAPSAAMENP